jgi:dephospho-CoA kinase
LKKIGITGCIGSGKTTVSRIFMQLGIPVYNADSRAKWLMESNDILIRNIKEIFGSNAYTTDGALNRSFIAAEAFKHPDLLKQLNQVVHPFVFADFDEWCNKHSNYQYIVKEAALMFESDSYKQLDEIIVVTAPESLRIERSMQRDGSSKEAVLARMKNQMTEAEKLSKAHHEIKNDEEHLLIPQVLVLHNKWTYL